MPPEINIVDTQFPEDEILGEQEQALATPQEGTTELPPRESQLEPAALDVFPEDPDDQQYPASTPEEEDDPTLYPVSTNIVPPVEIPEPAATRQAAVYDNALEALNLSPGVEKLHEGISAGESRRLRTNTLIDVQAAEKQQRFVLAEEFIDNQFLTNGEFTFTDASFVRSLTQGVVTADTEELTETVIEREYGKFIMRRTQTNIVQRAATRPADMVIEIGEEIVAKQELVKRWLEGYEAQQAEQGGGQRFLDEVEMWVPWHMWTNLNVDNANFPRFSWLPGNNVKESLGRLHRASSLEDLARMLREDVDPVFESNPETAMMFLKSYLSFSASDQTLMNVIGYADLSIIPVTKIGALIFKGAARRAAARKAGFLTGKAQVAVEELSSSVKHAVQAAAGRTVSPVVLKEASGKVQEAAYDVATVRFGQLADATNAAKEAKLLIGEVPSLFNVRALIGTNKTFFTAEFVARLVDGLRVNAGMLVGSVVDAVPISRLTPDQIRKGFELLQTGFNRQFSEFTDSIIAIRPVAAHDTATGVDSVAIIFGKKTGLPFSSEAAANRAAKAQYRLKEKFTAKMYGDDNWYIEVIKAIDETSPEFRDLAVATEHLTPKGMVNATLGYFRTGEDIISTSLMQEFKQAALGSSNMARVLSEVAKPINRLSKGFFKRNKKERRELEEFMEHQRDATDAKRHQRGVFSENLGQFVQDWQVVHKGQAPSELQAQAYFTARQINDMNYMMTNLNILRDKTRQGLGLFTIPSMYKSGIRSKNPLIHADSAPIEGKLVDEVPINNPEQAGIVVVDDIPENSVHLYKNTADHKFAERLDRLTANGEWKVIQLTPEGRKAFQSEPWFKGKMPDKSVDFIVSKNVKSQPLAFKNIDYRAGGSVEFPQGFFVRQPIIRASTDDANRLMENFYSGDISIYNFSTKTEAQRHTNALEKARNILARREAIGGSIPGTLDRAALTQELKTHLEGNLPHTVKEFEQMFKQINKRHGTLDLNTKFYMTALNENVASAHNLKNIHTNFRDSRRSSYNLYNSVNLKNALERGEVTQTIIREGSPAAPLYKLRPAKLIDPLSVINRNAASLMRGRFLEDAKIKASEGFIREFSTVLAVDVETLRLNPVDALVNAKFVTSTSTTSESIKIAKNYRRTAMNFLGLKNDFQREASVLKQNLADYIFEKGSTKTFALLEPYLLSKTKDPVKFFRQIAFHSYLGLFNPVQLLLQTQTIAHVAGVEGLKRAYQGMAATAFMRPLGINGRHLQAAARKAKRFGWTEKEFVESWEGMQRTGWYNIGGEIAVRDDFMDPNIITTRTQRFFDKGTIFFNEGERMTRMTAWNASYKSWRFRNPHKKFDVREMKEVLQRADLLAVNMTSASLASWNKGFASIPTQFFNYQVRLAEQFLGKRLTGKEKTRAMLVYATLYGVPTALGAPVAIFDFYDTIKRGLLERGVDTDMNAATQFLNDGIMSMMLEYATGTKFNVGGRLGPGGLQLADQLQENGFIEMLLGASGQAAGNAIRAAHPFIMDIVDLLKGDQTAIPLIVNDFVSALSSVSSVNNATKAWYGINAGIYLSKNEMLIDDVTKTEGIFMGLGLLPERIEDAFAKMDVLKVQSEMQAVQRKAAIAAFRRGLRLGGAKDPKTMAAFFARFQTHLGLGGFRPDQEAGILREALEGQETFVETIGKDFGDMNDNTLKQWNKEKQRLKEGKR